eukprot:scaffold1764_cov236-Pinguiococcus_pyrenoidosus.AAC.2
MRKHPRQRLLRLFRMLRQKDVSLRRTSEATRFASRDSADPGWILGRQRTASTSCRSLDTTLSFARVGRSAYARRRWLAEVISG